MFLSTLYSSPLDDFFGNIFGKSDDDNNNLSDETKGGGVNTNFNESTMNENSKIISDDVVLEDTTYTMSLSSFQQELNKRQQKQQSQELGTDSIVQNESNGDENVDGEGEEEDDEEEFSGYDLRDIIYTKYGECFDVEFQRVDSYGFQSVYLVSVLFGVSNMQFICVYFIID